MLSSRTKLLAVLRGAWLPFLVSTAAALAIVGQGKAHAYDLPEDMNGLQWQGTVDTTFHWIQDPGEPFQNFVTQGSIDYSNMQAQGQHADSDYFSDAEVSYKHESFACVPRKWIWTNTVEHSGPYEPESEPAPTFELISDEAGLYFRSAHVSIPGSVEGTGCSGDEVTKEDGVWLTVQGFPPFVNGHLLEQDSDPDLFRVAGTTTWNLGHTPGGIELDEWIKEFTFTINYDLELVPIEETDCNDGVSNDFDGIADYPLDSGCTGPNDASELGSVECDNGQDDDGDGSTDWPADTTCPDLFGDRESVPECEDGVNNNDFDGLADFPLDPGCSSATDDNEFGTVQCDNGIDDDGDGFTDWPLDGFCGNAAGQSEGLTECTDGFSNDLDTKIDADDPGCSGFDDLSELGGVACDNGVDDDGDGRADYPADPECKSPLGVYEDFDCRRDGKHRRVDFQYKARAVIRGPDAHLYSFEPTVHFCYGNGQSEITAANVWGDIDSGPDEAILEALGFRTEYSGGQRTKSGNSASFDGKFVMTFNFLSLANRFGLGKLAKKGLAKQMRKRLKKALRKHDTSSKARTAFLKEVTRFREELVDAYRKRAGKAISGSPRPLRPMLLKFAAKVEEKLDDHVKKEFEVPVKSFASSKEFSRMTADQMAAHIVDGVGQAISSKTTKAFRMWEPFIEVDTHPDGRMTQSRTDAFLNPNLAIDYAESVVDR